MSEWIEASLAQLVSFQKGKKVETSPEPQPGFLKYLGASGIEGKFDGYASPVGGVMAKPSDMLMLWDGERSGLVGFGREGVVASTVTRLSIKTDIEAKFLYYLLADRFEWIQNRRTGTGVPHVPKDIGRMLLLRFPRNLRTQKRIAVFLSSIDSAIEKTESLIEKYQHIKAGLMYDLFTRGVLPNGQLRPFWCAESAAEYKSFFSGVIPKEWGVIGLRSIGRAGHDWIRTGPFGSALKSEHWRIQGVPVVTIGSLGSGRVIESELLSISEEDANRLSEFKLKEGDVVFSRVADVGRSVVIGFDQSGWIMSSNLMRIAVDSSLMRPEFLQLLLAFDHRIKAQIRALVNSGGRDLANSEVLNQLRFPMPALSEQDRVIAYVGKVDARLESEQLRLKKFQLQKSGLMQDLLTGKVPVPVPEHEATDG
jgi:type I restriction enzyme S subunit